MHCETHIVDLVGTPAKVIVCGSAPRKKFCRFCGRPADALCDWPKIRRVEVAIDQVKVGDEIFEFRRAREPRKVVYVKPQPQLGEVWIATEWQGRVLDKVVEPWKPVLVARRGTCDTPCCYQHRRHVAPDVDYCRRHWQAWSEVT